jgi:hypothetical protein
MITITIPFLFVPEFFTALLVIFGVIVARVVWRLIPVVGG